MRKQNVTPLYEHVISGIALFLLVVPLIAFLSNEPEIDQLGSAFYLSFKFTLIPFFIIFTFYCSMKKIELKRRLKQIFTFSIVYTLCSICPILLINMYIGKSEDYVVSGTIIEKKPGTNLKASLKIKTVTGKISFRLPKDQWKKFTLGEQLSIKVKKGSLGLLYKKYFPEQPRKLDLHTRRTRI